MCKILRSQFYSERLSQPMVEIKVYVNLYNVSWACPLRQMLESHTWGGNVRSLGSLLYCSTFYSDHSAMLWWWSENRDSLCLLIHTFINSVILITRVISHLHSMFALLCSQLDTSLKRPHYSPLYCPVYIAMNFVVIKSIRWDLESPPPLLICMICVLKELQVWSSLLVLSQDLTVLLPVKDKFQNLWIETTKSTVCWNDCRSNGYSVKLTWLCVLFCVSVSLCEWK